MAVNVPVTPPGAGGLRGIYGAPNTRPVDETAYTLNGSDNGRFVVSTCAAAFTLTIPTDLPSGFTCGWSQKGAGTLSLVAGAGVTLQQRQSHTDSAGQYAFGGIANIDTEFYVWGGDTA